MSAIASRGHVLEGRELLRWKKIRKFYDDVEFKAPKVLFLKSGKQLEVLGFDHRDWVVASEAFLLKDVDVDRTINYCRRNVFWGD
jgi:hypothetical protein